MAAISGCFSADAPARAGKTVSFWGKIVSSNSLGTVVNTLYLYRSSMGNLDYLKLKLSKDGDRDGDQVVPYDDGDLAVQEAKPELKRPPLYKVVMLNDDYTPMDFVVEVLETFFAMTREKATRVMLTVHTEGKAVCGVFTRDIAETKAAQVNQYARENQHPLLCEIEVSGGDGD